MSLRRATVVLVSVVALTAGCGSGGEGRPAAEGSSGAPSATSSPSPSATATPEPEVREATGPRLKVPEAALRLPDDDWIVLNRMAGSESGGNVTDGIGYINISSFPELTTTPDLEFSAKQVLARFDDREGFDVRPGEDLEIGGVEGRTFVGTSERGPFFLYLAIVGTTQASKVTVEIETSGSTKAHQRVVDTVLASLEWR